MKFKTLIFLLFISHLSFSQSFADKKHFLIDSLDMATVSPEDKKIIDSCITLYHQSKNDSIKLSAINSLIEGVVDENVWPRYNLLLLAQTNELIKKGTNKTASPVFLKRLLAGCYNNIGYLANQKGKIKECLDNYSIALKLREELKNDEEIAYSLNNIGYIYRYQKDFDMALDYYSRALEIQRKIKNEVHIGYVLNNIASIYKEQKKYSEAKKLFEECLEIHRRLNDTRGITIDLSNLGGIYFKENNLSKALELLRESYKVAYTRGDLNNFVQTSSTIADIYYIQKKYKQTDSVLSFNLPIAEKIKNPAVIKDLMFVKYKYEKLKGNEPIALKYYELFISMKDSILNESTKSDVIRQNLKYEFDKQKTIDELENQKKLALVKEEEKRHKIEAEKQKQLTYFLVIGLILSILAGGFIYNRFQLSTKQKRIIEIQKQKVDTAYSQLEEKNKEIMDSIYYAKRIQAAILPPDKNVKEYLKNSFILYKPKDIVAGDFYWLEYKNGKTLFAAADCTGHGVPGAMVSVVCNNGLNRSVREHGLTEPGKILEKTREIVIQEFEKSENEVKDGMDIALCCIENNRLQYAGANNPLWIARSGEMIEIKADKQPIGKFDNPLPYTTHTIELKKGDTIYIFSDGYADQFGGVKGKKFKASNFKTLLLSIQQESMEKQKQIIEQTFEDWRGTLEQIDDVCVMGVRI